jgi:hypothetical protein
MRRRRFGDWVLRFGPVVGASLVCLMAIVAMFLVPIEVRHSAPFGVARTLDAERSVAVSGARLTATYDNFDRIDLDLRAYTSTEAGDQIDLIVSIRGDTEGPDVLRSIPISVAGWQVSADKPAFDDVFTTVRFDPIQDSAGRAYYVWVERGPANGDDVVTLWSVKSYSTVRAAEVLAAFVEQVPVGGPEPLRWVGFACLGIGALGSFGVMMAVFLQVAIRSIVMRGPPAPVPCRRRSAM